MAGEHRGWSSGEIASESGRRPRVDGMLAENTAGTLWLVLYLDSYLTTRGDREKLPLVTISGEDCFYRT